LRRLYAGENHLLFQGTSKNSIKAMMARQKTAKMRSLHVVNEQFELFFNAASAALVNF
jgi:hypothetical protein